MTHISFDYKQMNSYFDIYKAGIEYFIRVKRRSVESITRHCQYRANGGADCCAVGAFIPDDNYTTLMEGLDIGTLVNRLNTGRLKLEPELDAWLAKWWHPLSKLQALHDSNNYWGDFGFNVQGWAYLKDVVTSAWLYDCLTPDEHKELHSLIDAAISSIGARAERARIDNFFG